MTVLTVDHDGMDHVVVTTDHIANNDDRERLLDESRHSATGSINSSHLPDWVQDGQDSSLWGEGLNVLEWQDDGGTYRNKHGWQGRDLVHDKYAPVRVLKYYVQYGPGICPQSNNYENDSNISPTTNSRGGVGTELSGVAHFTPCAESHKGYCHGGSMCSLLDDVIGWVAFLVTGECRPWTGFTVQVNSNLQRPIPVDSVLLVQAKITAIERRKVSVEASIVDPKEDNAVHASGTGLVVMNRGVLPET